MPGGESRCTFLPRGLRYRNPGETGSDLLKTFQFVHISQ
jgi:hypothetical protein